MPAIFMALSVAGYGWRVYGAWAGIAAGFFFALAMLAVSVYFFKIAADGSDVLTLARRTSRFRWGMYIVTMLAIGLSAAESCSPNAGRHSLWWG